MSQDLHTIVHVVYERQKPIKANRINQRYNNRLNTALQHRLGRPPVWLLVGEAKGRMEDGMLRGEASHRLVDEDNHTLVWRKVEWSRKDRLETKIITYHTHFPELVRPMLFNERVGRIYNALVR